MEKNKLTVWQSACIITGYGVGGGIMGVVPRRMGIGVYSPALDKKGNSVAGIKALEMLSAKQELSIF